MSFRVSQPAQVEVVADAVSGGNHVGVDEHEPAEPRLSDLLCVRSWRLG